MATESEEAQALRWRIIICALIVFFAIVVLMVGIHLYPRWYLVQLRLRHHQIEVRRRRRRTLPGVVSFADSVLPGTAVERRLELPVLNSLPVFLYTPTAEQPECVVCLSEFEEKETVRLLPKCNHSFHIECLDMWFQSHSTCPLCRSPVEKVACRSELLNEGGTQSQPSYFAIFELHAYVFLMLLVVIIF